MSDYKPQAGDKVKYKTVDRDGTVVTTVGVVHEIAWNGSAYSENERTLYNPYLPERTTLLRRPINTARGTVYQHPTDESQKVLRTDTGSSIPWVGSEFTWLSDETVQNLVDNHSWVEL